MAETNISPAFSLAGWDWKKWLKGNKDSLKILVPFIVGYAVTNSVIDAGIGTIVIKFILDIVDYFVSEVQN